MQLIKGKPSGQQKYLRYFIGIIASIFRVGTGGCADWSASSGFPGCRDCDGVSHYYSFKMKWTTIWSSIINIIDSTYKIIQQASWSHRIIVTIF